MSKFYFLLWLSWSYRVTVSSVFLASLLSLIVCVYVYFSQGMPIFSREIFGALFSVFKFYFPLFWSLTFLLALFRALKHIFNKPFAGYELKLLECGSKEVIEVIGYGDLVKVWRKWFMLIIWLVGAQMIIAIYFTNFFTSYSGVFEWFNIYFLYVFVLLAGYISFIILAGKCKRVKVVKC